MKNQFICSQPTDSSKIFSKSRDNKIVVVVVPSSWFVCNLQFIVENYSCFPISYHLSSLLSRRVQLSNITEFALKDQVYWVGTLSFESLLEVLGRRRRTKPLFWPTITCQTQHLIDQSECEHFKWNDRGFRVLGFKIEGLGFVDQHCLLRWGFLNWCFFTKRENMINLDACYMIGNFSNIKDFLNFFFLEVLIIPFWDFFGKLLCTSNNTSTISIFLYVLYILSHDSIFLKYKYLIQFQYFQGALIMNSKWNYIFLKFIFKAHLKYGWKLWFFSQKCIMLQNNWNFQLGDD